jgi:hypothetical protein
VRGGDRVAECARGARRHGRRAGQHAQPLEVDGDVVDRFRVGGEDRDAAPADRRELRRGRVRPRDDEVGRERDEPLEVDRVDVADARQARGLRREVRAGDDADDLRTRARREQELGGVWRELNDPARRRGERDARAGIVDDCHLRARGGGRKRRRERHAHDDERARRAHQIAQRSPANHCAPPVA